MRKWLHVLIGALTLATLAATQLARAQSPAEPSTSEPFSDSSDEDYPVWAAPLSAVEQVVLEAIRAFDPALTSTSLAEQTEGGGMLIRQIRGAELTRLEVDIQLTEQRGLVVLGVFDLGGHQDEGAQSFAARLLKAVTAAVDKRFPRGQL